MILRACLSGTKASYYLLSPVRTYRIMISLAEFSGVAIASQCYLARLVAWSVALLMSMLITREPH